MNRTELRETITKLLEIVLEANKDIVQVSPDTWVFNLRGVNKIVPLFDQREEAIRKEKDTQWHDNIQRVKEMIKGGKNPQEERDENVAYDNWHPELALLWEIAIEVLALKEE